MKVIINADDFGKSLERNQAVDAAFKQGLICSAGVIVTSKYLSDAIHLANEGGYLNKLHIHFNLSANLLHENSDDTPLTDVMKNDPFFCRDGRFLESKGIPSRFSDIKKNKEVYRELVAQYYKFMEVTKGVADYKHIDFHLWYNLSWLVCIPLRLFVRKFKIESVRYWGIHQMGSRRFKMFRILSNNPRVTYIPATNIDYFLTKKQALSHYRIILSSKL